MVLGITWADTQRDVSTLARGVAQAAAFAPIRWGTSIVGGPRSLLPPYGKHSEYRRVVPGYATPLEVLRYWPDVLLPSLPVETPDWAPSVARYFTFRPSVVEQVPDKWGSSTSFPDEAWFFVNGILTNDDLARFNASYLAHLFRRPVTVVQNATSGALLDLVECAVGKAHITSTEAAKVALPPIYAALTDPGKKRVVIVAHSQGTIIAANVLQRLAELHAGEVPGPGSSREGLQPLDKEELAKLEVYAFANCATQMRHIDVIDGQPVPHVEFFANEWDLVARLGAIAPDAASAQVLIDGPVYVRPGAHGHLLNEHYLIPVEQDQVRGQRPGGDGSASPYQLVPGTGDPEAHQVPRLYSYLNGGRPE